jgi:hypothetical protein
MGGFGNSGERNRIHQELADATKKLATRRAFIFQYAVGRHYELKFSGIAQDIFARLRERVDQSVGVVVPDAIRTVTAIYDNLASENPEDWSNAVHGCRRLLKALADALYPPRADKTINSGGKEKTVKLGEGAYVNRLIAFVEEHSDSGSYKNIVGSHLSFMGERLDAIVDAAQKGTHDNITTREEAERYVIYTYMLVGDILSLASRDRAFDTARSIEVDDASPRGSETEPSRSSSIGN